MKNPNSIRERIKRISKNALAPMELRDTAKFYLQILNSRDRFYYFSKIQSFADRYRNYANINQ